MTAFTQFEPAALGRDRGQGGVREFSMRGRVVTGSLLALLLVGGIGGWASTATLSGAVMGTGTVSVVDNLQIVQHVDGGIVREIAVREGDRVAAGDVLLRLDGVQIGAERTILLSQMAVLIGREARLVAERDGADSLSFPEGYFELYPDAAAIAAEERQLFAANRETTTADESRLRMQIDQIGDELAGLSAQRSALQSELTLAQTERAAVASLVSRQLLETNRLTALDRDLARVQGQLGEVDASESRARSRIGETEIALGALGQTARTEAQRQLGDVMATLAELRERLGAIEDRLTRAELRAPVSGVVNDIAVSTLGAVVTPAQDLVTIVPEDSTLRIEVPISPNDVEQISVGQPTRLRLSAFNQRTTPEVNGEVSFVAAAAQVNDQTGQAYYTAHVMVTDDLSFLGEPGLVPGMPVEVFVQTRAQTALAYFLRPFTDQVTRAFREE